MGDEIEQFKKDRNFGWFQCRACVYGNICKFLPWTLMCSLTKFKFAYKKLVKTTFSELLKILSFPCRKT